MVTHQPRSDLGELIELLWADAVDGLPSPVTAWRHRAPRPSRQAVAYLAGAGTKLCRLAGLKTQTGIRQARRAQAPPPARKSARQQQRDEARTEFEPERRDGVVVREPTAADSSANARRSIHPRLSHE
jgi:hypothetical protein